MTNVITYVEDAMKTRMSWWGISLIKIAVLFFTLAIADVFPVVLSWDWQVYYALSFVAALPVVLAIFKELWFRIFYAVWYGLIYLAIDYFV